MADPQRPRKTKDGHVLNATAAKPKAVKVSKATIDSIKRMGMTKAIEKANTHAAPPEFVEGAKRMYGNRINTPAGVGKKAERPPDRANSVSRKMKDSLKKTQVEAPKKPKKPFRKNESAI